MLRLSCSALSLRRLQGVGVLANGTLTEEDEEREEIVEDVDSVGVEQGVIE